MKDSFKIYLGGGMEGLTESEQSGWRNKLKRYFENDDYINSIKKISCFNPVQYFNLLNPCDAPDTDKECMRFDLRNLKNSDLLVVNNNCPSSLGTMAEIATAYERNIPILILSLDNNKIHSWAYEMADRIFEDMTDLVDYIVEKYIE